MGLGQSPTWKVINAGHRKTQASSATVGSNVDRVSPTALEPWGVGLDPQEATSRFMVWLGIDRPSLQIPAQCVSNGRKNTAFPSATWADLPADTDNRASRLIGDGSKDARVKPLSQSGCEYGLRGRLGLSQLQPGSIGFFNDFSRACFEVLLGFSVVEEVCPSVHNGEERGVRRKTLAPGYTFCT